MTEDVRSDFEPQKNPVKAIRLKCRDCTNNQVTEIEACTVSTCPLHPFRSGKNPFRTKRKVSEERKAEMAEHLKKARQQKDVQ